LDFDTTLARFPILCRLGTVRGDLRAHEPVGTLVVHRALLARRVARDAGTGTAAVDLADERAVALLVELAVLPFGGGAVERRFAFRNAPRRELVATSRVDRVETSLHEVAVVLDATFVDRLAECVEAALAETLLRHGDAVFVRRDE